MSRRRILFPLCLSTILVAGAFAPPTLAKTSPPTLPSLSGAVTDAGGHPVSGATVYVSTAGPRVGVSPSCPSCYADCGKHAATDVAGHFVIPTLSRYLIFRLLVVRDGYVPTYISGVDPLKGAAVRVALAPEATPDPARTVTGTVVGPDGQPIAGATVEPDGVQTSTGGEFGEIDGLDQLAVTDSRGQFRFRTAQPNGTVDAMVKARGLATQAVTNLVPGPGAANRVTLAVGSSVAGVVRDAKGRGLPGVTVEVVPTDRNAVSFTGWQDIGTNADGRFLVPNVPAERQYTVCVMMSDLARRGLGAPRQVTTTGANGTTTGVITLVARPVATVVGRVSLEGGKPIPAGTRVMLDRDATWDSQQVILTPDGSFAFHGVPTGEMLDLDVRVNGYRDAVDTPDYDKRYRRVRLEIPAGVTKKNVPVVLVPDGEATFTIRISGTPGTKFGGTYSTSKYGSGLAEGSVPAQYTVTTDVAWAHLQTKDSPNVLKVEILKGEAVVASGISNSNGSATAQTR